MESERHLYYMQRAIDLAAEGMLAGAGGPFGCVVVREDKIIAEGYNQVIEDNDPTAHAEVVAIRKACTLLGTFQLEDCTIYASCEPCPMCLGAIYWARPKRVFYACDKHDAAAIGFDDHFIYEELGKEYTSRHIPFHPLMREEAQKVFDQWKALAGRVDY